jgi:hypothetical protein
MNNNFNDILAKINTTIESIETRLGALENNNFVCNDYNCNKCVIVTTKYCIISEVTQQLKNDNQTLYLKNKNLDDSIMEKIFNNCNLFYLKHINISDNIKITNKTIDLILNNDVIGCDRPYLEIDRKFNCPVSNIYINAENTSICNDNKMQKTFIKYIPDFPIYIKNSEKTFYNGKKILEIGGGARPQDPPVGL